MKVLETRAVDAVEPGSVLAAAVVDEGGRVLMPAGGVLTEAVLKSFERREIAQITIEVEIDEVAYAARRARCEERVGKLFRQAGDDLETRTLYQTILQYRIREGGA